MLSSAPIKSSWQKTGGVMRGNKNLQVVSAKKNEEPINPSKLLIEIESQLILKWNEYQSIEQISLSTPDSDPKREEIEAALKKCTRESSHFLAQVVQQIIQIQ